MKSPTGFYPFWAGIGGKEHLPIFKHLFNPAEFWTPFPVPTISMDYPNRQELRRIGWAYWNWSSWPMTTSRVVDAAARAAKDLDPSLTPGAAELLMRYTKVHFIKGDLKHPCVSEYFDPVTGAPNAPNLDYAHSYYIDLILRHVVGIEADPLSDEVRINPLNMGLEYFEARNIRVKAHDLSVSWKHGKFTVSVDGKSVATATELKPLKVRLSRTATNQHVEHSVMSFDGYSEKPTPTRPANLGVQDRKDGRFVARAAVVGTNPAATGDKCCFGLDSVLLANP